MVAVTILFDHKTFRVYNTLLLNILAVHNIIKYSWLLVVWMCNV